MTQGQLEDRLSRWYAAEVDSSPPPPSLHAVLDGIGSEPVTWRRPVLRWSPLLVAAILLAIALAGAAAIGSQILRPDRSRLIVLDPASLDPCAVLPGPGWSAARSPGTHAAPRSVGGDACGYGWDNGGNVHLQLRDQATDGTAADRIARDLFVHAGGIGPSRVTIDGHAAWIGPADWLGDECAAMAVSADPYFFVVWLTCRPNLPSGVDWDGYREDLVAIGRGVLQNLDALNDGRPPPYRLAGGTRGWYGWDP